MQSKCNKVSYQSKADALADANMIHSHEAYFSKKAKSGRSNTKGQKLRPYKCFYCDKWHLTTLSKSVERLHRRKNKHHV